MAMLKVTAKGQVTLRKSVLRHLGAGPGSRLEVEERPGGEVVIRRSEAKRPISSIFGILHRPGQRAMSIEEMDEAIGRSRMEAFLRETSRPDET